PHAFAQYLQALRDLAELGVALREIVSTRAARAQRVELLRQRVRARHAERELPLERIELALGLFLRGGARALLTLGPPQARRERIREPAVVSGLGVEVAHRRLQAVELGIDVEQREQRLTLGIVRPLPALCRDQLFVERLAAQRVLQQPVGL